MNFESLNILRRKLIPRWTTAQLPPASAANKGLLAFDVTVGKYKASDGSVWYELGGGAPPVPGIVLQTATASFTAAQLNFATDSSDRVILNAPQGTILNPVNIWAKLEYPNGGGSLPSPNDGFVVGLKKSTGGMVKLGQISPEAFSVSGVKTYYPVLLNYVYPTWVNQQVQDLEIAALRLRAVNQAMTGGDYTLKFRILYELINTNDFI